MPSYYLLDGLRGECAIDNKGRIIYENLYSPTDALVIDDEVYDQAIVLEFDDFSFSNTTFVAQTDEGQLVVKSVGDPTGCSLEIPDNFVSSKFSAAHYLTVPEEYESLSLAVASVDQSGQIHVWTDCPGDELITDPPSLADFIDIKIGQFFESPLTGVALTENGDVYMWGSLEQPTLIDSGIRSISVGNVESRAFFGVARDGSAVAWDTLGTKIPVSTSATINSFVDYEDSLAIIHNTASVYEATPETITTVLNSAVSFDQITLAPGQYEFSGIEFNGKRFAFNGTSLETQSKSQT